MLRRWLAIRCYDLTDRKEPLQNILYQGKGQSRDGPCIGEKIPIVRCVPVTVLVIVTVEIGLHI